MKKVASLLILMALFFCSCENATDSQVKDYYIVVENGLDSNITFLYISPVSSSSWEEDVLGQDILRVGQSIRIELNGYTSPYFDIKAIDANRNSYEYRNLNVEEYDLTINSSLMVIE